MTKIYIPSRGPEDWKRLLAKPELHWAVGYSARSVAYSWEATTRLPLEIEILLRPHVGPLELLLAISEHKVSLPGGQRESQCDVFALIRGENQTIACAVEGKVDEPFGPTVGQWLVDASPGKLERLTYIRTLLGLPTTLDPQIRYQLLHRTASAVIEAERFMTSAAAMIVHSFSAERRWFADYAQFARLFGLEVVPDRSAVAILPSGKPLFLGWASGDQRYRAM